MRAEVAWRRASDDDAVALRDLERAANLVGLGHVFAPERFPFPDDDVLARWALVLADPGTVVEVVDGPAGLRAFLAYDDSTLRHLAVHPRDWGTGLGRLGVERAVGAIPAAEPRLWVLELNTRARGLYEHLGWSATGVTQNCPWAPHPLELEYVLRRPRGARVAGVGPAPG